MEKFDGKRKHVEEVVLKRVKFVDFGVYQVDEKLTCPGFLDSRGQLVVCYNENEFLKCFGRLADSAVLTFNRDMQKFESRFEEYALRAGFDTNRLPSMREAAVGFIYRKAQDITNPVNAQ